MGVRKRKDNKVTLSSYMVGEDPVLRSLRLGDFYNNPIKGYLGTFYGIHEGQKQFANAFQRARKDKLPIRRVQIYMPIGEKGGFKSSLKLSDLANARFLHVARCSKELHEIMLEALGPVDLVTDGAEEMELPPLSRLTLALMEDPSRVLRIWSNKHFEHLDTIAFFTMARGFKLRRQLYMPGPGQRQMALVRESAIRKEGDIHVQGLNQDEVDRLAIKTDELSAY